MKRLILVGVACFLLGSGVNFAVVSAVFRRSAANGPRAQHAEELRLWKQLVDSPDPSVRAEAKQAISEIESAGDSSLKTLCDRFIESGGDKMIDGSAKLSLRENPSALDEMVGGHSLTQMLILRKMVCGSALTETLAASRPSRAPLQ